MRAFRMTDCASSLPGRSPAIARPGSARPAPVPPRSPRPRKAGVWRSHAGVRFVAFCLGQVPAPAGFPGIHPGIAIKREVHPGAVGDPSPVAAGPELSVPLVKGVARLPVSAVRQGGDGEGGFLQGNHAQQAGLSLFCEYDRCGKLQSLQPYSVCRRRLDDPAVGRLRGE